MLQKLKETKDLSWEKIAEYFPNRSPGTLQVHYYTKLKARELVPKKRAEVGKEDIIIGNFQDCGSDLCWI